MVTKTLVSIDPGVHHAGVAYWEDGKLKHAYLLGPVKDRWLGMIDGLNRYNTETDTVVVEIPQVYPGSRVRPEDLIQLAASAGALARTFNGLSYIQARPAVWTKQTTTNKAIRLGRAWERLTPHERSYVDLPRAVIRQADVLDAIALGLWYLKRW